MRRLFEFFLIFLFFFPDTNGLMGQSISRKNLFEQDSIINLFLYAHLKNIDHNNQKDVKRPGFAKLVLSGDREFSGPIQLHGRGNLRFKYCDLPPLMLYFKTNEPSSLRNLGKLKMVWSCSTSEYYDQLVIKEYLIYKLYNLLTPYSFRVRLLNVIMSDSAKPANMIKRKGFLIEDIDEVARRNDCREYEDTSLMPIETDQWQYALVTVFQYMIANTDWSISNYQNIKMVIPDTARIMVPLVIPYDFDNSGLVNAEYAAPHESLPIENVRQRYNKGMKLQPQHIENIMQLFRDTKPKIMATIESCEELKPAYKKDMIKYLNEFFDELENGNTFKKIFLK